MYLLNSNQNGFRSGRSYLTQLLEYLEDLGNAPDEGDCVDVVYLDRQKAFDTVPHGRLLARIKVAGVDGEIAAWIKNFSHPREQGISIL